MRHPGRPALLLGLSLLAAGLPAARAPGQPAGPGPVLHLDAGHVTGRVSPTLYGLMTEEINYSYDGGLYAELIRNRTFQDNPQAPEHWSLVQDGGGAGSIALDPAQPLNPRLPVSLRLDVARLDANQRVGVANEGFWGIAVRPHATYRASFYAKAAPGFTGSLLVSLESGDGTTVHARAEISDLGRDWQKYTVSLATGALEASAANRLVLAPTRPGTVWFDLVSLFPPTYHGRPNGNRTDIMQLLAGMKPAFLRFPGGNYLEGRTIDTRFPWKQTIGDLADRPGHMGTWTYRSSDGLGLLEYLEWCEDLHMQPVLAVFAGLTLDRRPTARAVAPGPALQPFVQDALDEIEYVTGSPGTRWGAERARDGHPAPFPLTYVEIGNEDNFDRQPGGYDGRFAQFYDALKARWPRLQLIATAKVTSRAPDVQDDHYYRQAMQFYADANHYDSYSRAGPKIFVGEWATREREAVPTPNLGAALGDGAWMTGMERNSDLIVMASYAPLFVNVSPGDAQHPFPGMQWRVNLIGYDALGSYGSPSYYAQQMFSLHHGDEILATSAEGIGTREWQPPAPRGRTDLPPRQRVPTLFFDATRRSGDGLIILKVVNPLGAPQDVRVEVAGAGAVEPRGRTLVLSASDPAATNSIAEPTKVVPVTGEAGGLGADFRYAFPAYSITILELPTHPPPR